MGWFSVQDASFLFGESRDNPMHVAGLQLFELPVGAGADFVTELHGELLGHDNPRPLLRRRPVAPVGTLGKLLWTDDEDFDLEYHVRLLALPRPGRVRELLELVSRMHGTLLDRHRPLWETNLIDGLEDNRFAVYTKIHHALTDGVSATRQLVASLSADPAEPGQTFWEVKLDRPPGGQPVPFADLLQVPAAIRDVVGYTPHLARIAAAVLRRQSGDRPFTAPRTMLNVPVSSGRRFAAQSWPLDRLKKAGAAAGATLNDVVLAMCAGALRRYLLAAGALPDQPLLAGVPVSLRVGESSGGNEVGLVVCNLATSTADPHRRLETIVASMNAAKAAMSGFSRLQIQLQTVLLGTPAMLNRLPGYLAAANPPYNLIISNVPGPRQPLYWHGARMTGHYPISIPHDGQALNITVLSYAGQMGFGITGCRRSVPHLQHLLGYLEDSLAELEI